MSSLKNVSYDWLWILLEPFLLQNNVITTAIFKVGNQRDNEPKVNREFNIFLLCFNIAVLITALFLMFKVRNSRYPNDICNFFFLCLAPHIYVPVKLAQLLAGKDKSDPNGNKWKLNNWSF